LCSNGREAEAQPWFDRAIADADYASPAAALANAASCAFRVGQYGRVDEELRRALLLDPGNAVALETMAANQYRLGQYFDARAFVERRLAAAPATASVLQLAMQIESGLGDMVAARRYSQRLQTEFPPAADANPGRASSE
jgi:type IV pilus assembly protein PilF